MPKYTARLSYVATVAVQIDAPDWHAANEIARDLHLADVTTPRVGVELVAERQYSRVIEPTRPKEPVLLDMPEWLSRYPKP